MDPLKRWKDPTIKIVGTKIRQGTKISSNSFMKRLKDSTIKISGSVFSLLILSPTHYKLVSLLFYDKNKSKNKSN